MPRFTAVRLLAASAAAAGILTVTAGPAFAADTTTSGAASTTAPVTTAPATTTPATAPTGQAPKHVRSHRVLARACAAAGTLFSRSQTAASVTARRLAHLEAMKATPAKRHPRLAARIARLQRLERFESGQHAHLAARIARCRALGVATP